MKKKYIIAENVLHLPPADAGLHHSIVRIHNSHVGKKGDREKFYRHQPVIIINPNTGAKTLRFVMGSHPHNPILAPSTIMVDYETKVELDWNESHIINVLPASKWAVYRYYWNHPDTGYRVSSRLGIIGVVLGVISLILTFF